MFLTQAFSKFRKNIQSNHSIKKSSSLMTHDRKSFSTKHLTHSNTRRYSKKLTKFCNKTEIFKRKYISLTSKIQTCSFSHHRDLKSKWTQIVDLYKGQHIMIGNQKDQITTKKKISPGFSFYKMLGDQTILKKHPLKINFPETIIMDSYGEMKMIFTNQKTLLVDVKQIQKNQYFDVLKQNAQRQINQLKKHPIKYKKYLNFQENPYAPYLVAKNGDDDDINFQIDTQTYKIFTEKKTKPTQNKLIQRYVYSRNMKAMIFRFCYEKNGQNEQKQEYYGFRFQNVDNIFRSRHSDIMESNKLTSVIFLTYERENKIEYSKIVNKNGLKKFIDPSICLVKFLQSVHRVRISKIHIDYMVDLFDQPWLINIKMVQTQQDNKMVSNNFNKVQKIVSCKVCADTYQKNQLKKYASNKMVAQFIDHLKKRMKVQDYDKIRFLKNINKINTKQHITFHICEGCYLLISQEFMLIENQKKLAGLCNIKIRNQFLTHQIGTIPNEPKGIKQWRLMIFLPDIVNVSPSFLKNETVNVKYHLKQEIEESWNIRVNEKASTSTGFNKSKNNSITINKIKVHYFFSETNDIDKFLKQTQINLTLSSKNNNTYDYNHQNIASGSTGILSHFCNRYQSDLCLRQTSALLLFFGDGKYCEASIKVGLVCDGVYSLPQNTKLKKIYNVYFAEDGYVNSNPIPREWMEAFGINEQMNVEYLSYEEIVERRKNRIYEKENESNEYCQRKEKHKNKKRLQRRSVCYL